MAAIYFVLLIFVTVGYAAIEIMSETRNYELSSNLALALKNAPSQINIKIDSPRSMEHIMAFPDSIDISTETIRQMTNSNVTISVPLLVVTLFLIFAIYGLLRHHLRRINAAEDRIYFLERIVPVLGSPGFNDKDTISLFLGLSEKGTETPLHPANSEEPPLHPGFEILEKSIDMLSDINKSVRSKFKS